MLDGTGSRCVFTSLCISLQLIRKLFDLFLHTLLTTCNNHSYFIFYIMAERCKDTSVVPEKKRESLASETVCEDSVVVQADASPGVIWFRILTFDLFLQ